MNNAWQTSWATVCSRYIPDTDDMKDVFQESLIQIITHIDWLSLYAEPGVGYWFDNGSDCLPTIRTTPLVSI